jgi:hypothetical protein
MITTGGGYNVLHGDAFHTHIATGNVPSDGAVAKLESSDQNNHPEEDEGFFVPDETESYVERHKEYHEE